MKKRIRKILAVITGIGVFAICNLFGPIGMFIGIWLGMETYSQIMDYTFLASTKKATD